MLIVYRAADEAKGKQILTGIAIGRVLDKYQVLRPDVGISVPF